MQRKVSRKKQGGGVGWGSLLTHSPFFLLLPLRSLSLATLHNLNAMENIRESPFLLNDHDFLFFFYFNLFTRGNFAHQRKGRWVVGHGNFQGNVSWFFPFSPVSLTELCSTWYGLKDLFTPQKLADKVVLELMTSQAVEWT